MSEMKPVAWVRRWYYEGRQPPPKVKNAKGRWEWPKESKFVAVTPIKLFADDVALYAQDDTAQQLITRLTEALADMTQRFERCAVHAGSDIEFVKEATAEARDALAVAKERAL